MLIKLILSVPHYPMTYVYSGVQYSLPFSHFVIALHWSGCPRLAAIDTSIRNVYDVMRSDVSVLVVTYTFIKYYNNAMLSCDFTSLELYLLITNELDNISCPKYFRARRVLVRVKCEMRQILNITSGNHHFNQI